MKLNINESKMLTEMAKIGSISNKVGQTGNYFIYVYGNEKTISHLHIKEKTGTFSCCVELNKADYFSHNRHKNVLTKELKKSLIHFLNQPNKKDNRFTNYEACVFAWNILNDGYEINTTVMPDYEQLETLG